MEEQKHPENVTDVNLLISDDDSIGRDVANPVLIMPESGRITPNYGKSAISL